MRFKDICWIFQYIPEFILSIQPLLLNGIHKYSLNIFEIFWNVRMENGVFVQIRKDTRQKTGTHFALEVQNEVDYDNGSSVGKYVKDGVYVIIYDIVGWDVDRNIDSKIDGDIGGLLYSGIDDKSWNMLW